MGFYSVESNPTVMETVSVDLPDDLVEGVEGLAEDRDCSRNQVVRSLLDEWLRHRDP